MLNLKLLIFSASCLLSIASAQTAGGAPGNAGINVTVQTPPPPTGYQHHLIRLPPRNNEDRLLLKLSLEKLVEIDDCQTVWLTAKLEDSSTSVAGIQHTQLTAKDLRVGASLNSCVPAKPVKKRAVYTYPVDLEYSSSRPILIYTPIDISVYYQVWVAEPKVPATSP